MAVSFENRPLQWDETGIKPSESLRTTGYKPNDNPAAENENFFRNRTYKAIEELQAKAAGVTVDGLTYDIANTEYDSAEIGCEVFNDYTGNIAAGKYTHVEGYLNTGSGLATHTEGMNCINLACASHAQNWNNKITENGYYGHAGGEGNTVDGYYGFIHAYFGYAYEFNTVFGKKPKVPTASPGSANTGDLLVVGNGLTTGSRSNAFRVTAAGEVMGTQAFAASGADFAECFEWLDGNPDNEDRRGLFVTLDGEKIRLATPEDDYILGVVSATPTIVGDASTDDWNGKYVTDEFGAKIMENDAWKLSADFDESLNDDYTSRLDRPEWAAVGLVGKLVVRCDDTVQVNGYCRAGANGIATDSFAGYRVMSVNNGYAKILLK